MTVASQQPVETASRLVTDALQKSPSMVDPETGETVLAVSYAAWRELTDTLAGVMAERDAALARAEEAERLRSEREAALAEGRERGLEEAAAECDRFASSGKRLYREERDADRAANIYAQELAAKTCAGFIRSLSRVPATEEVMEDVGRR